MPVVRAAQEAENERMHLLTALEIRQPKLFLRLLVLATQGVFFNAYFLGACEPPLLLPQWWCWRGLLRGV